MMPCAPRFCRKLAAGLTLCVAVGAFFPAIAQGVASGGSQAAIPDFVAVRHAWRPSDLRVLAMDGTLLQRIRTDYSARRGDWIPLSAISAALQRAVIHSEDRRFYAHGGVDWFASASAAWSDVRGAPLRGASTLSMQLAAMLQPALHRGPDGRSVMQKLVQMQAAWALERRWSKAQILEAYLNLAAYRGELVGVDAVSRVLFQKRASGLTLREAALAAVLLRGPNAPVTTLVQRSCALLRDLGQPARCAGLRDFVQGALARGRAPRFGAPQLAPHWARFVLDQGVAADPSGTLRTTLDPVLQRTAVRAVHQHLVDLGGTGVTDAAVVVLDNRSGAVRAYVGSSGLLSAAPAVDHARALRQAGSTLKPFLYGLALDAGRLTAASLLDDRPLDLAAGSGLYVPDNYDHRFTGWVSVRTALASSLNVPAVRTLVMVGPDRFAERLRALGLPLDHGGDYYGYSLALGSADVSLLSLTNAYRALARGGRYAPVVLHADEAGRTPHDVELYTSQAAWLVGDILADRQARARTFGLDSPLSTPFWTAVKTGTSRDMRDNWCVGWSADYTVGVWVGNSEGASMRHVSGVSGAGPIWHDVLMALYRHQPPRRPAMPPQLVSQQVHFGAGIEPARTEYFLGDTAQAAFIPPAPSERIAGAARIAEPVDGTVLALDPDIPWDRQRMRLRAVDLAARPDSGARWRVDGAAYGTGGMLSWVPRPGHHHFELVDAAGVVIDQASVQVHAPLFRGLSPG